jgi:hypothetical protein
LTEAALRGHHTFTRRLLEQAPGNVFDVGFSPRRGLSSNHSATRIEKRLGG